MRYQWLLALLIISFNAHSQILFECMKKRDYKCLADEIDLDQDWQTRVDEGSTPLQFAIQERDASLVRYLIRRGARVTKAHIYAALESFFPDHHEPYAYLEAIEDPILERLLLSTIKAQKGKQFDKLVQVLGLLAPNQQLLYLINKLKNNDKINNREINILFREYRSLFYPFCLNETHIILENSVKFNNEKFILLMIVRGYQSNKNKLIETIMAENLDKEKENKNQKIAYAIITNSQRIYLSIIPQILRGNYRDVTALFDQINDEINCIINFIKQSIVEQRSDTVGKLFYGMWLDIYRIVVAQGDFLGAFAIDLALNSECIKKFDENYNENSLADSTNNYNFYREHIKVHKKTFFIPAWEVFLKDITDAFINKELFDKDSLNEGRVEQFFKLKKNLKKYLRNAQKRKYISTLQFHDFIAAISRPTNLEERPELYKKLAPRQRCTSMRFDMRAIRPSNSSKAVTPRF